MSQVMKLYGVLLRDRQSKHRMGMRKMRKVKLFLVFDRKLIRARTKTCWSTRFSKRLQKFT